MIGSVFGQKHSEVFTLSKSALVLGLMAIAALPLSADTIVIRTGSSTGSLSGVTSLAVSWTQTGSTFTAPSFSLTVHSTNGLAATATAYLTNAIGSGATAGTNQLGTAPVSVSAVTPTPVTVSFPSASLAPGTYYLVLSGLSANFAWDFVSGGATETLGTGVTAGSDLVDLATPAPAFPPSASTFVTATAGGSSHVLIYSLTGTASGGTGTPPPSGVPTLGTFGLIGTGTLLAFAGLLFLKRQPANPLR